MTKKGTMSSETMLVCKGNDGPVFKGAILWLNDEIVSIRCELQNLLAVSVTVPVYINYEYLTKWRTDLQNKTPNFIESKMVLKSDGRDMQPIGIVIIRDSLPFLPVAPISLADQTNSGIGKIGVFITGTSGCYLVTSYLKKIYIIKF